MARYALQLDPKGRVLSATFEQFAQKGMPLTEQLPKGDITDYLYKEGAYVHDPLPKDPGPDGPTRLEEMAAQITYTALKTNTLIGGRRP